MLNYAPVDDVQKAEKCAMLFIIAEKEELFDNKDNGIKAHALAKVEEARRPARHHALRRTRRRVSRRRGWRSNGSIDAEIIVMWPPDHREDPSGVMPPFSAAGHFARA
jgi:hypothetical protein